MCRDDADADDHVLTSGLHELWFFFFFFLKENIKLNERHVGVWGYLVLLASTFGFFSLIGHNVASFYCQTKFITGNEKVQKDLPARYMKRKEAEGDNETQVKGIRQGSKAATFHSCHIFLGSDWDSVIVCRSSWNWQTILPMSAPLLWWWFHLFFLRRSSGDVRVYHVGRGLTFSSLCIKEKLTVPFFGILHNLELHLPELIQC